MSANSIRRFDRRLYETYVHDNLSNELQKIWMEWLSQISFRGMREKVKAIYQKVDSITFGIQLFDKGKLKSLTDHVANLEELLHITLGSMGSKFFRDHLNHMTRTFLLGMKLADGLGLGNHKEALGLACLLHDIAFPLQEIRSMSRIISEVIGEAYCSLNVSETAVAFSHTDEVSEFLHRLVNHAKTKGFSRNLITVIEKFLFANYLKFDHGILGAIETYLLLDKDVKDERVFDALLAIALHSFQPTAEQLEPPDFFGEVARFPEFYLLVLADELQEWGRPVFSIEGICNPLMNEVKVRCNVKSQFRIVATLDYRSILMKEFSPLTQLVSKVRSLLRLHSKDLSIKIIFDLPKYKLVQISRFGIYEWPIGIEVTGETEYVKEGEFRKINPNGLYPGLLYTNSEIDDGLILCTARARESLFTSVSKVLPFFTNASFHLDSTSTKIEVVGNKEKAELKNLKSAGIGKKAHLSKKMPSGFL